MGAGVARQAPRPTVVKQLIGWDRADAWMAALEGIAHLRAHGPDHGRAMALASGEQTFLYVCTAPGGRVVCPVALRPVADGGFDVVTPLGFAGFAATGDIPDFADYWTAFWRERGAVCAYLQLNPITDRRLLSGCLAGLVAASAPGNQIYLLDLRPSLEALFAGMGRDHRSRLRSWRRAGEHRRTSEGDLLSTDGFGAVGCNLLNSRSVVGTDDHSLPHAHAAPVTQQHHKQPTAGSTSVAAAAGTACCIEVKVEVDGGGGDQCWHCGARVGCQLCGCTEGAIRSCVGHARNRYGVASVRAGGTIRVAAKESDVSILRGLFKVSRARKESCGHER